MSVSRTLCALALTSFAISAPAAQRTFVSAANGLDTNPCSRNQPCRNLQQAYYAVDPDGEVIVLDSGGYGTMLIINPASVIAPEGVYAGVTVSSGTGITISATSGSGKVLIRGLTLNGLGGGNGIYVSAGSVVLERITADHMSANGILAQSAGTLIVRDCLVQNSDTGFGMAGSGSSVIHATIVDSLATGGRVGFGAGNSSRVTIAHSVATNNSGDGFVSCCTDDKLQMSWCTSSNNASIGVWTNLAGSEVFVSSCAIIGNAVGLQADPGSNIYSLGNNFVSGNTTATSGSVSTVATY
jgi:parallel beta helix pectate lyase-like protein